MLNKKETRNFILSVLNDRVEKCRDCNLCNTPGLSVFGEGSPEADIMFIGEAPGEIESQQGRPFVGPAGKLLDNMISSIDLKREDVYIANIVKHRPPKNRNPRPNEIESCLPYLKTQIEIINPLILVVLGSVAVNSLLPFGEGITKRCGNVESFGFETKSGMKIIPAIPVFHPSALLRNTELKKPAWFAMQKVKEIYNKGKNDKDKKTSIGVSQRI